MSFGYIVRRLGVFVLVVWTAMTVNFFIPRIPEIGEALASPEQRAESGEAALADAERQGPYFGYYTRKFRLDRPLPEQYLAYLGDLARLDLGYSMRHYPETVQEIIGEALPWTLALLGGSTLIAFSLGTLLGVFLAWPGASGWAKYLSAPLLALSAIPFYLLGLVLNYVFGFLLRWLPMYGAYPILTVPAWDWAFIVGVLRHAILPSVAIILSALAFWALGMRAMVVTVLGDDYMLLAEAKGLKESTLMLQYGLRNAILPQTTSLALSMGNVVAGAVLVELVFGYPGIGSLLRHAILVKDYFLLQGVIFTIILAVAVTMLVLDLALPLLDPRITYRSD